MRRTKPWQSDAKTEMTEAELLHFYLELRFGKGQHNGSLDDVMAGFAEYRRQLAKVRELIAEGLESSAREGARCPLIMRLFGPSWTPRWTHEGYPSR